MCFSLRLRRSLETSLVLRVPFFAYVLYEIAEFILLFTCTASHRDPGTV